MSMLHIQMRKCCTVSLKCMPVLVVISVNMSYHCICQATAVFLLGMSRSVDWVVCGVMRLLDVDHLLVAYCRLTRSTAKWPQDWCHALLAGDSLTVKGRL